MNNKGNIFDSLDMAKTLFITVFGVAIIGFIFYNIAVAMGAIPQFQTAALASTMNVMQTIGPIMDYVTLAIYVIMLVGSVIFARSQQLQGINIVVSYAVLLFVSVIHVILGYMLYTMLTVGPLAAYAIQLPISLFYATYAPYFALIYCIAVLFALHGGNDE